MKSSPEILNELMTISPLLARLDKVNIFQVPEGYFNDLHLRITDYAILNNTSPADDVNKRNLHEVPPGYFDTLSDSILAKVKAMYGDNTKEELNELPSVLNSLKNINVFSVPDGYFNRLSDSVIHSLKNATGEDADEELSTLSTILFSLKEINVLTVPDGYFDSLSASVLAKIKEDDNQDAEEELRKISPLLYAIKGENVFSVPRNYFESFAREVLEKVQPRGAKVITMKKRTSWLRYAAAAIVTGIITVSSFILFNRSHKSNSSEIALLPDYVKASLKYKTSEDLNAGIAKLSDADIIKYLEKNGNVMDNELLTNNTDVSELPSTTDYLSDENTLSEYLDKVDTGNVGKLTP